MLVLLDPDLTGDDRFETAYCNLHESQVHLMNGHRISCSMLILISRGKYKKYLLKAYFLFQRSTMSKRTALNEHYKGLVESMSIPAELHERNGKIFASFGSVLPIHCASPEQVSW